MINIPSSAHVPVTRLPKAGNPEVPQQERDVSPSVAFGGTEYYDIQERSWKCWCGVISPNLDLFF